MKLSERFPIVNRNLKSLMREKTFILLVLLLLFIILTMSILIFTVMFLFNPQFLSQEDIKIGVLVNDTGLPFELRGIDGIDYIQKNTSEELSQLFNEGELDAIIVTQETRDFDADPLILNIIVIEDPLKQSVALSLLKPALEKAESRFQSERDAISGAVWQADISFGRVPISGADTLYQTIFSVMLPLILIIPIFLIGNLFVDMISQEKEEGNMPIILSVISPIRYMHEFIIQAVVINSILTIVFLLLLKSRFFFIENIFLTFIYLMIFLIPITLLSIFYSFAFEKIEVSQLLYTFTILSIFLFSPFFTFSPNYVITELLLGHVENAIPGIAVAIGLSVVLYVWMRFYLQRLYY
jgi:hypothetical protein